MTRLYLTAEGQTEQTFARRLLAPFLAERGVYLLGIRLTALRKKKGHVHRGGMSHYLPVKNDIRRWLREDRASEARFTTMLECTTCLEISLALSPQVSCLILTIELPRWKRP